MELETAAYFWLLPTYVLLLQSGHFTCWCLLGIYWHLAMFAKSPCVTKIPGFIKSNLCQFLIFKGVTGGYVEKSLSTSWIASIITRRLDMSIWGSNKYRWLEYMQGICSFQNILARYSKQKTQHGYDHTDQSPSLPFLSLSLYRSTSAHRLRSLSLYLYPIGIFLYE